MLDFHLNSIESAVQQETRCFALEVLRPFSLQADKLGDIPREALEKTEVVNMMQTFVPESYGGGWLSMLNPGKRYPLAHSARLRVIAAEEFGYGDASLFMAMPGPGMVESVVRALGSSQQQQLFFSTYMGSDPKWAAFALTEPKVGSDATAITTTATKDNGDYVINGTKRLIVNGARGDWLVVFATVNPKGGRLGIRAFLLKKGTPGFRVNRILDLIGLRAIHLSELVFEDCRIPEEYLLLPEGMDPRRSGFQAITQTFNLMRPVVSALSVGIARAAIEHLEEIVIQNGASHAWAHRWQEVEHRIECMKGKLLAARLLCWKAAWLHDQGQDTSMASSLAKAYAPRTAVEICTEVMELAGKAAVSDLSLLQKFFRDVKAFDILEGTGEIQRLIISKMLSLQHTAGA